MKQTPRPAGRRAFLAATGTAAAAGAAVVATQSATVKTETVAPAPDAHASTDTGYRLSEHVRKYYRTTRV